MASLSYTGTEPDTTDANGYPDEITFDDGATPEALLEAESAVLSATAEGIDNLEHAQETLHDLAIWKLDVNDAGIEQIEGLPGLTGAEAELLVAYRKTNGPLRNLRDLSEAGLSQGAIASILPYITFDRRRKLSIRAEIVQRWSRRLTHTEGYRRDSTESRYLGTPDALLTRAKVMVGNRVAFGAVLEKDAGEPMALAKRLDLGHDFAAAYAMLDDVGPFKRVVVGDFASQVGNGLLFGQSGTFGVGPRSLRMREYIRPHSSSREYGFFRGAAIQTRTVVGFQAAIAVSRRSIDARYDTVDGTWNLSATGLHRTDSERSRRSVANEWVAAWIVAYRRTGLRLGIAGATTRQRFGAERKAAALGSGAGTSAGQRPSPQRRFDLRAFTAYGLWTGRRFGLTVEVAPRDSGLAVSGALRYTPSHTSELWIEGMHSTPGGYAPHSSIGVDSRGATLREASWSSGVRFRPSSRWTWTTTTRRRWRPAHPIEGGSLAVSSTLDLEPSSWFAVRLRAVMQRNEDLGSCESPDRVLRCSVTRRRHSLRLQIDYRHSRTLRHRMQVETSEGVPEPGLRRQGILLYKDVRWRPSRRLQVDARILFFDVADYEARIYAFENDVLYSFSAPVYSGRGRRAYVLIRCALTNRLALQVKYGVSAYEDVDSVGSGLDETAEPVRKDVRVQVRWKLGAD